MQISLYLLCFLQFGELRRGGEIGERFWNQILIIYVHTSYFVLRKGGGGGCRGRNFCNPKYDFHDVYK